MCTNPEPLPDKTKSSFEFVTFITLSVKFIDESIVKFLTLTTPVPVGLSLRSAFELVEIMLSLKVRLSTVTESAKDVVPDTVVKDPMVVVPAFKVPVVLKFSFPKLNVPFESVIEPLPAVTVLFMAMDDADVERFSLPKSMVPPESVIDPFANVKFPIVDPVPLAMVPVVVMFSLPKLMAPDESVMDPLTMVMFPIVNPVVLVVVDRFSFPKSMLPLESFMIPLRKSRFPNCEPVAADRVPVVVKFSFPKLIDPPK